jgi:hypothetical protein
LSGSGRAPRITSSPRGEVWTDVEGINKPIGLESKTHETCSPTRSATHRRLGHARRRLNPDGPRQWDVDRAAAKFRYRLIDKASRSEPRSPIFRRRLDG